MRALKPTGVTRSQTVSMAIAKRLDKLTSWLQAVNDYPQKKHV